MGHDSLRQHNQTRAVGQRKVQIMGHGDAQFPQPGLFPQQSKTVQLMLDVEKCRRLIEQQGGSVLRQACGQ
jgi:hypothetical protein